MKYAVFSCLGLGDGLITLILSHNLKRNGVEVTTFHPQLSQMQRWFPGLPIASFPKTEELAGFDRFFIFYEKTPWMHEILDFCIKNYRDKTIVLNPLATTRRDYAFWEEGQFDGNLTFAENLVNFCKTVLHLKDVTKSNGLVIPDGVVSKRFPKRTIIHPMSSKGEKNWHKAKYILLAQELKKIGFDPQFALSPKERELWMEVNPPLFNTLDELATFVCESGHFVGNDSGVGHLSSCLGLSTVTICRNKRIARFWRPDWSQGTILYPPFFVPNLKFMRFRDKYWKNLISVRRVVTAFQRTS